MLPFFFTALRPAACPLPLTQEVNAILCRCGENVKEELKRSLYGTASVSQFVLITGRGNHKAVGFL